jgi:tetratricopeptide (TPR) repeat protein
MRRHQTVRIDWVVVVLLVGLSTAAGQEPRRARAPARGKGENYAFLVAAGEYDLKELKPLKYPRGDILAFYRTLRESGFPRDNIVLMHDKQERRYLPEAAKIRTELKLLLARVGDGDTVVVALSGHGVQFKPKKGQKEETPYFCPVDARLADRSTLLGLDDLYRQLKGCRARRKLLIVDACRNDPQSQLSKSLAEVDLEKLAGPQKLPVPSGIVALFSCSAGEQSWEHPDLKHGVFFHFLLKGWKGEADRDGDGTMTLDELAAYVKKQTQKFVHLRLRAAQRPELKGEFSDWVVHPVDVATRAFLQGKDLLQTCRYDEALAKLSVTIRLRPKFVRAYLERGRAFHGKHDYRRAIGDYTEALRLDPACAEALVLRGEAALPHTSFGPPGNKQKAAIDFQAALPLIRGQTPKAYILRGDARRGLASCGKGTLNDAIADYSTAIELDPNSQEAYVSRGYAFRDKDDYNRAIADFTRAIKLNPNSAIAASAYHALGDTLLMQGMQGDCDKAIVAYTEAIRLDPKSAWNFMGMGWAYQLKGQYNQAIANYSKAIDIDPRFADPHTARGWLYYLQGKHTRAIADLTQAIRLSPQYADNHNRRGLVFLHQKNYRRALDDLNKAIRIQPRDPVFYENRAQVYEALKDYARARADRQKAKRLARSR